MCDFNPFLLCILSSDGGAINVTMGPSHIQVNFGAKTHGAIILITLAFLVGRFNCRLSCLMWCSVVLSPSDVLVSNLSLMS